MTMSTKPELKQDRGMMENPVDLNGFIQIAIVVPDIEAAALNFGELVDRGYRKRVEHIYEGGSWTIIDSEESLGVNLNIKPEL